MLFIVLNPNNPSILPYCKAWLPAWWRSHWHMNQVMV